ncbi:MAG: response regulator transcription factor [Candidatus Thermochlorobacter sp.]
MDKVVCFKLGADDCVTKPFSIHELRARIEAVLRRSQSVQADDAKTHQKSIEEICLSLRKKLEPDAAQPKHLLTVHTSGYKFVR